MYLRTTPSDPEYVQGYLTYREAENWQRRCPGTGGTGPRGKKQAKPFPSDNWWFIYDSLRKELDHDGSIKERNILPLRYAHEHKERSGLDRIYERRQIPL